jgi:hypothetical protein
MYTVTAQKASYGTVPVLHGPGLCFSRGGQGQRILGRYAFWSRNKFSWALRDESRQTQEFLCSRHADMRSAVMQIAVAKNEPLPGCCTTILQYFSFISTALAGAGGGDVEQPTRPSLNMFMQQSSYPRYVQGFQLRPGVCSQKQWQEFQGLAAVYVLWPSQVRTWKMVVSCTTVT